MNESLTLFATHLRIRIAEDETNGGEEVTLARTIATHDYIEFGGEGVDNGLILVAAIEVRPSQMCEGCVCLPFEALDGDLFDMHRCAETDLRLREICDRTINHLQFEA